jgi:hypothetical protein
MSEDWTVQALIDQIQLDMRNLARKELGKLSKEDLIDFILDNIDLVRNQNEES